MFEIKVNKKQLLPALLIVSGAVDRKQSLPILANVVLKVVGNKLFLTATDLEIEITANITCESLQGDGSITAPAKKFVDIIRSLDDEATPTLKTDDKNLLINNGRSRFKLSTLSAQDYPSTDIEDSDAVFDLQKDNLIDLLQSTHFALSQQDIRAFLNGLLLEIEKNVITTVGMDGHRMAIYRIPTKVNCDNQRVIIPRRGVHELLRLLNNSEDDMVRVSVGKNHIKILAQDYVFISKLIESRFPAYNKAIPKCHDKRMVISTDALKRAIMRITILANEKSRAIKLSIDDNLLTIIANNPEQEEAYEEISAKTEGDSLKIAVNASYLLDVLNYLAADTVNLSFGDTNSSILVEALNKPEYLYVIMPMKI